MKKTYKWVCQNLNRLQTILTILFMVIPGTWFIVSLSFVNVLKRDQIELEIAEQDARFRPVLNIELDAVQVYSDDTVLLETTVSVENVGSKDTRISYLASGDANGFARYAPLLIGRVIDFDISGCPIIEGSYAVNAKLGFNPEFAMSRVWLHKKRKKKFLFLNRVSESGTYLLTFVAPISGEDQLAFLSDQDIVNRGKVEYRQLKKEQDNSGAQPTSRAEFLAKPRLRFPACPNHEFNASDGFQRFAIKPLERNEQKKPHPLLDELSFSWLYSIGIPTKEDYRQIGEMYIKENPLFFTAHKYITVSF